jgi:hypothetical protein
MSTNRHPRALAIPFTSAALAAADGPTLRDTARALGIKTDGTDNDTTYTMLL